MQCAKWIDLESRRFWNKLNRNVPEGFQVKGWPAGHAGMWPLGGQSFSTKNVVGRRTLVSEKAALLPMYLSSRDHISEWTVLTAYKSCSYDQLLWSSCETLSWINRGTYFPLSKCESLRPNPGYSQSRRLLWKQLKKGLTVPIFWWMGKEELTNLNL